MIKQKLTITITKMISITRISLDDDISNNNDDGTSTSCKVVTSEAVKEQIVRCTVVLGKNGNGLLFTLMMLMYQTVRISGRLFISQHLLSHGHMQVRPLRDRLSSKPFRQNQDGECIGEEECS